jgi:hypothetical protein
MFSRWPTVSIRFRSTTSVPVATARSLAKITRVLADTVGNGNYLSCDYVNCAINASSCTFGVVVRYPRSSRYSRDCSFCLIYIDGNLMGGVLSGGTFIRSH